MPRPPADVRGRRGPLTLALALGLGLAAPQGLRAEPPAQVEAEAPPRRRAEPPPQAEPEAPPRRRAGDADQLEKLILSDLPRVITAAAFREQLPEEAPAAVIVVTAEEIRGSGARTLGEALERCAGIRVDGGEHLAIRGVGRANGVGGVGDAGRILLLIDGTRINDVFTDSFTVGLARGVYDVARIEIVKGPGSALYGTSAFAGVVNVVTLTGGDASGLEGRARGGLQGGEVQVRGGGVREATQVSGSARLGAVPGEPLWAQVAEGRAGLSWKGLSVTGGVTGLRGFAPSEGAVVSTTPNVDIPPSDPEHVTRVEGYGAAQGERAFRPWLHGLARASVTGGRRQEPGVDLAVKEARGAGEGRLRLRLTPWLWTTAGAEARIENAEVTDVREGAVHDLSRSVAAGYAQVEAGPLAFTTLTAGLRAERSAPAVDDGEARAFSTLSPRAALVTSLPTGTVLKGFYGHAFQAPSLAVLFTDSAVGGVTILANPTLEPERLRSAGVEASQRLGMGLELRVNVFQDDIDDLISVTLTEEQNVLEFNNFYDARIRGIEGEVGWSPSPRLATFGNVTVLDAYNRANYRDLPLVPRLSANAGVRARPISRATLFASARWISERKGTEGDPLSPYLVLDPQLSLDVRVGVDLSPRWELAFTARNILGGQGVDFEEGVLVETPGTELWLELSLRPPPRGRRPLGI